MTWNDTSFTLSKPNLCDLLLNIEGAKYHSCLENCSGEKYENINFLLSL